MEGETLKALAPAKVVRHIPLIQGLMKRFCIHSPKQCFNLDESGAFISNLLGRSTHKGVGRSNSVQIHKAVRTRGASDRITVMLVISDDGRA